MSRELDRVLSRSTGERFILLLGKGEEDGAKVVIAVEEAMTDCWCVELGY